MRIVLKKKIILIIGIILILIGSGIAFSKKGKVEISLKEKKENSLSQSSQNIDSDNDGLFDWQEVFYGTDPKNPDTDQDGTLDGEEIKEERNPLKKGNDDLIQNFNTSTVPFSEEEKINFTQYFASVVLGQIITDAKVGNSVSSKEDIESVLGILEKKMPELLNQFEVETNYPQKNSIRICKTNSKKEIEKYFETFLELFPPIFEKYDSEFLLKEIFTNYNSKPIETFTKELKEKKEKFENQCVPQGYLEIHQEMIGFFSVIENIFETFLDWKNDPLKTLVAIEELKILSERVKNFSQILEEKLKQDGFNL